MHTPKKTRHMVAVANGCLSAGLMLFLFAHPAAQLLLDLVHGTAGLLLGISIGLNLHAVLCRKRQQRASA